MELGPFNISYANKKFLEMMEKAKNTNFINFQHDFEYRSLIVFDGNENEVSSVETRFKEKIKNIAGITENTREECEEEWKDRFNPMRIKRRGPTLLAGDLLIPLNQLKSAIDELNKLDMNVGIEGNIAAKDKAIIMPMYLADERNAVDFLFALRHLKKINDIAVSAGGIPYGIGLWNTPYIKKIMGVAELKRKKEMKKKLDPNHILNPDKHLGIGLILPGLVFNSKIYALSMFGLRILSKPFRWLKIIKS